MSATEPALPPAASFELVAHSREHLPRASIALPSRLLRGDNSGSENGDVSFNPGFVLGRRGIGLRESKISRAHLAFRLEKYDCNAGILSAETELGSHSFHLQSQSQSQSQSQQGSNANSSSFDKEILTVERLGKNPSALLRRSNPTYLVKMEAGKRYVLRAGDELSVLGCQFTYRVRRKKYFAPEIRRNVRFYRNEVGSSPDGKFIDDIHASWRGDYDLLESLHGYIQWLFPITEGGGMNFRSKALHPDEQALMAADPAVARRVVRSYRLMLDFFGLRLVNDVAFDGAGGAVGCGSGTVVRAYNWQARFSNVQDHPHNLLRLTRILTSLGELGFGRWVPPLAARLRAECAHLGEGAPNALEKFWQPVADHQQQRMEDGTWPVSVWFTDPSTPESWKDNNDDENEAALTTQDKQDDTTEQTDDRQAPRARIGQTAEKA